ncbi:MAG: hypothetical protein L3J36_14300 [Rhodobacteraceae bacterium]|nr:hypothetical protein [Paracoccaceae bacterium]
MRAFALTEQRDNDMACKDILGLDHLDAREIDRLTRCSVQLAADFRAGRPNRSLEGRRIALIVDQPGWRNTTALELGARMMGAHVAQPSISLSGSEAIGDLAHYLSNWFDLIAIRTPSLGKMTELADAATIPVLNLRTRQNHPCETLGDLSFVRESGRQLDGLCVVAVGAAGNILHSWAEAASRLPLTLTQIAPRRFWIDKTRYAGSNIHTTDDMAAIFGADIIITDCWPSDGAAEFKPYQVTGAILDRARPDCLFIPCPPVTRGQEVSGDAMTHRSCVVIPAKAHLLHAQNACLLALLGEQG